MLPKYQEFKDKVVVVTGGAGILCSEMVNALSLQGAKLAILDLDIEAANKVASSINDQGGHAFAYKVDVLSQDSLESVHQKVNKQLGPCDILINGAGGNHPRGTTSKEFLTKEDLPLDEDFKSFFDLDYSSVQFVFNLNFLGTLLPTQIFAKDMIGKKGCSIVNISSMNAFRPLTKIPAYSGAKAAVSNFTQWLAVHFSKVNIRVNALAPGFFLTDQNRTLLTDSSGELTSRGKVIIEHTPMGRFGEPEDLLGTLLWLCSDSSAFITGIVIPIDGGFSSYSGV